MADGTVEIDGHSVPAELAELFYSGKDGTRLTDEEWDEQKRVWQAHGEWPWS